MKKQDHTDALNEKIRLLQMKRERELNELKEHAHLAVESLKPKNLLKSTYHKIVSSPEIKSDIVNNAIAIATGFLAKKMLMGSSKNPVKRMLGRALQFGIAAVVSKNSDAIRVAGEKLLLRIFNHNKKPEMEFSTNGNGRHDESEY
jgi:hypothetical protein